MKRLVGLMLGLLLGGCVAVLVIPEKREPLTIVALTELGVSSNNPVALAQSPVESLQSAAVAVSQPTLPSLPAALAQPVAALSSEQPELKLPFPADEVWYFTGGAHVARGDSSIWAAVDFAPGGSPGVSRIIAPAPGLVVASDEGAVSLDLDGDGSRLTGWVLDFMHVSSFERVDLGSRLSTGDYIGHPSTEGAYAGPAAHLHFTRLHDGEFVGVDDPEVPLILSGWGFSRDGGHYQGSMWRGNEVLSPVNGPVTVVTSDNIATGK